MEKKIKIAGNTQGYEQQPMALAFAQHYSIVEEGTAAVETVMNQTLAGYPSIKKAGIIQASTNQKIEATRINTHTLIRLNSENIRGVNQSSDAVCYA